MAQDVNQKKVRKNSCTTELSILNGIDYVPQYKLSLTGMLFNRIQVSEMSWTCQNINSLFPSKFFMISLYLTSYQEALFDVRTHSQHIMYCDSRHRALFKVRLFLKLLLEEA